MTKIRRCTLAIQLWLLLVCRKSYVKSLCKQDLRYIQILKDIEEIPSRRDYYENLLRTDPGSDTSYGQNASSLGVLSMLGQLNKEECSKKQELIDLKHEILKKLLS